MTMDITGSLVQAGQLMLVGMVVVFVFLGTLVWLTKLLSETVLRFQTTQTNTAVANVLPTRAGEIPPQTVAAITAAVHQYRQSSN
jgi:oxaloacetate decarboxylase gamma subunit